MDEPIHPSDPMHVHVLVFATGMRRRRSDEQQKKEQWEDERLFHWSGWFELDGPRDLKMKEATRWELRTFVRHRSERVAGKVWSSGIRTSQGCGNFSCIAKTAVRGEVVLHVVSHRFRKRCDGRSVTRGA